MTSENIRYENYHALALERFESACRRCGECCGSLDGDPCVNLGKNSDGTCYCKDYENRLGPQRTRSGKIFECVPIRQIMKEGHLRPNCSYR